MTSSVDKDHVDQDGFVLVTRRRGKRKVARGGKVDRKNDAGDDAENSKEVDPSTEAIKSILTKQTMFQRKLSRTPLAEALLSKGLDFQIVVMYGLGTISSPRVQLQLALICLLLEHAKATSDSKESRSLQAFSYDPCHTALDKAIISALGINVMASNNKGYCDFGSSMSSERIFFYMPHCERWLYSNVIEHYWSCLERIQILGNSFNGYAARSSEDDWVQRALDLCEEETFSLDSGPESTLHSSVMFEAFNDTRLIRFCTPASKVE